MQGRTIKIIDGTDIVEVRYVGEVTYKIRIETLEELDRLSAHTPVRRLLINYTSAWPALKREPRTVSTFMAKLGCASFARVALVNATEDIIAKTASASKRAGYVFQHFDDRERAIEWLMEHGCHLLNGEEHALC
jgi:hypothetical protein